DQSEEEGIAGVEQVYRKRRFGRSRDRYEAVLYGDVCFQSGAAHPGVDYLSLEDLQSARTDSQADRFRLASGTGSQSQVWPGADVQLRGDPTLSRVIRATPGETAQLSCTFRELLFFRRLSNRVFPVRLVRSG